MFINAMEIDQKIVYRSIMPVLAKGFISGIAQIDRNSLSSEVERFEVRNITNISLSGFENYGIQETVRQVERSWLGQQNQC